MTETTTPSTALTILEWVDEVPAARTVGKSGSVYDELVAELKAHPGQWALVGDGTNGVNKTTTETLRKRGVLTKTRTTEGDKVDAKGQRLVAVYAGYFPPTDDPITDPF